MQTPASKTAKIHLLNLTPRKLLSTQGNKHLGALFESLAVLTIRVLAGALSASCYHLRTKRGDHEVDMIVQSYDGNYAAFEVKLTANVTDQDCRHLQWLRTKMGSELVCTAVIYTGDFAYTRPDGIAVIPLACLGN